MTKKDYVLIAAALERAVLACGKNADEITGVQRAAICLGNDLAQENPRFDRARFLKACGVAVSCGVAV